MEELKVLKIEQAELGPFYFTVFTFMYLNYCFISHLIDFFLLRYQEIPRIHFRSKLLLTQK